MKNAEQCEKASALLRAASREQEPPGYLETRLRAAFREQHSRKKRSSWYRVLATAAAASMVVCAVVLRLGVTGDVEAPPAVKAPQPAVMVANPPKRPARTVEQIATTPQIETTQIAPAQLPKRRYSPAFRRAQQLPPVDAAPAVSAAAAPHETEEFLAIPYAPPMTAEDRGEVVRVRLPRQSIRSLGIPISPDRLLERVPADVLVGEDGIPRGIRLVRARDRR